MSNLAIAVERLSKRYRIARLEDSVEARRSLIQRLRTPAIFGGRSLRQSHEDFWALRDVSFRVRSGEVVGLIGSNGAGKSTLLKILSRIIEPSEGRAVIQGRVRSLLEVGTGFHPELTGRENIYLSGAILGMRRTEIQSKFDDIVAFAEVEKFLDTPVKRYSSGMYVRLAFAVAAQLETEVLLVDEVLAVGDAAFQKKCLGRMGDVGQQGRTVLFVSHNMIAVQNLCQRVIWLQHGKVMADGPTGDVLSRYLSATSSAENERSWSNSNTAPGNDRVRLHRVLIRPEGGASSDLIGMSTSLIVEIEYSNLVPDTRMHVCLHVINHQQLTVFTTGSDETDALTRDNPLPMGRFRSQCRIPANLLNSGMHRIAVLFRQNGRKLILRTEDVVTFEVRDMEERNGMWLGRAPGAVHPRLMWDTTYLGPCNVNEAMSATVSLQP